MPRKLSQTVGGKTTKAHEFKCNSQNEYIISRHKSFSSRSFHNSVIELKICKKSLLAKRKFKENISKQTHSQALFMNFGNLIFFSFLNIPVWPKANLNTQF